jgi:hypothetical protein
MFYCDTKYQARQRSSAHGRPNRFAQGLGSSTIQARGSCSLSFWLELDSREMWVIFDRANKDQQPESTAQGQGGQRLGKR